MLGLARPGEPGQHNRERILVVQCFRQTRQRHRIQVVRRAGAPNLRHLIGVARQYADAKAGHTISLRKSSGDEKFGKIAPLRRQWSCRRIRSRLRRPEARLRAQRAIFDQIGGIDAKAPVGLFGFAIAINRVRGVIVKTTSASGNESPVRPGLQITSGTRCGCRKSRTWQTSAPQ